MLSSSWGRRHMSTCRTCASRPVLFRAARRLPDASWCLTEIVRRARWLISTVFALVLTSCSPAKTIGHSEAAITGILTGLAPQCTAFPGQETVKVYRGASLVASKSVLGGKPYRFTLTPGSYSVWINNNLQNNSPAVVRTGRTVHIPPYLCF